MLWQQQAWGAVGEFRSDLGRSQRTGCGSWVEVEGRLISSVAFAAGNLVDSHEGEAEQVWSRRHGDRTGFGHAFEGPVGHPGGDDQGVRIWAVNRWGWSPDLHTLRLELVPQYVDQPLVALASFPQCLWLPHTLGCGPKTGLLFPIRP